MFYDTDISALSTLANKSPSLLVIFDFSVPVFDEASQFGAYLTEQGGSEDASLLPTMTLQRPPASKEWGEWIAESFIPMALAEAPGKSYSALAWPAPNLRQDKQGKLVAGNPRAKGFSTVLASIALQFKTPPSFLVMSEMKSRANTYAHLRGIPIPSIRFLTEEVVTHNKPEPYFTSSAAEEAVSSLLARVNEALEPHDNIRASDDQYADPQEWWLRPLKQQLEEALKDLSTNS